VVAFLSCAWNEVTNLYEWVMHASKKTALHFMPLPKFVLHSSSKSALKPYHKPRRCGVYSRPPPFVSASYPQGLGPNPRFYFLRQPEYRHNPNHQFGRACAWSSTWANPPPSKDLTAAMGYCMAIDRDTGMSRSP
jgi:hypothetical protein